MLERRDNLKGMAGALIAGPPPAVDPMEGDVATTPVETSFARARTLKFCGGYS